MPREPPSSLRINLVVKVVIVLGQVPKTSLLTIIVDDDDSPRQLQDMYELPLVIQSDVVSSDISCVWCSSCLMLISVIALLVSFRNLFG